MTNVTLLDKARRGRANAIASLNSGQMRSDNVVSIFDSAFDTPKRSNVIEFRSTRQNMTAPRRLAA
jgi:hypothetical protein